MLDFIRLVRPGFRPFPFKNKYLLARPTTYKEPENKRSFVASIFDLTNDLTVNIHKMIISVAMGICGFW